MDFHDGYDLFIPLSLSFSLVGKLEFGRKTRLNPLGPPDQLLPTCSEIPCEGK